MKTKVCTRCHKKKSVEDFAWKHKSKGIRHAACRQCHNAWAKKNYAQNQTRHKALVKRTNRNRRRRHYDNLTLLGLRCERCGQDHPATLEFHHVDPTTKKFEISTKIGVVSPEQLKEEIQKCIVLCANCHRIHHSENGKESSMVSLKKPIYNQVEDLIAADTQTGNQLRMSHNDFYEFLQALLEKAELDNLLVEMYTDRMDGHDWSRVSWLVWHKFNDIVIEQGIQPVLNQFTIWNWASEPRHTPNEPGAFIRFTYREYPIILIG